MAFYDQDKDYTFTKPNNNENIRKDISLDDEAGLYILAKAEYMKNLKKAEESSLAPSEVEYVTMPKPKRNNAKKKAIIFMCSCILAALIAVGAIKQSQDTKVSSVTYSASAPLRDNKVQGGYNPNTGTPYWYYNIFKMYDDFDNDLEHSDDDKIYASYLSLKNEFNGMSTLDDIVEHLTDSASFEEYLKRNGYDIEHVKNWSKDMRQKILEEYFSKQNNLDDSGRGL